MRRLLVLFARVPAAERVKTRLAAAIGAEGAAELYGAFLADLARALAEGCEWERWVAVAGEGAAAVGELFPGWAIVPQAEGGLEKRLARVFAEATREGFAGTVVAGSDAPLLSAGDVRAAFTALEEGYDAAFSPAPDGGFSLVALGGGVDAAALFPGVRWSTEHALADCRARAASLGLKVATLPEVPDVDVAADLSQLRLRLAREPALAPETARVLRAWEAA